MNIDPQTGLDLDDPETQRQIAAAQGGPGLPSFGSSGMVEHAPAPDVPEPAAPLPAGLPTSPASPGTSTATPDPTALIAGQPTKSVTNEASSTTTTRTKVSDEEKAAQGEVQKTLQAREGVAQQAGVLGEKKATIEEDAAKKKAKLLEQHQADVNNVVKQADDDYKRKDADYKAKQDSWAAAKPESYWDNDPKGERKFWSGIAMALGGFAASRTGGRNLAYEQIHDSVEAFDKKEQLRIAKLERVAATAKGDRDDILARKHDLLADLSAKKAAALDAGAAQIETRLAALGKSEQEIKTNATILQLREDAQKERANFLQTTRQQISTTVQKKTQEIIGGAAGGGNARGINDARQRAMTAMGLEDQMKIAEGLEKKGVKLTEDDRQRIQDNRAYLKAIHDSHGVVNATITAITRKLGAAPRSEFDGLSDDKAALAGALNLGSQKAANLAAGAHTEAEMEHARGLTDLLAPGLGSQEQKRRREYIHRDLIGANKGLVPEEVLKARTGADREGGGIDKTAIKSKLDAAADWVRKNPKDPQVGAVKTKMAEYMQALRN